MKKLLISLGATLLVALGATALAPAPVAAQCVYGCSCSVGSCGCNSRGNGGRCDAGATGCVVSACTAEDEQVTFAADGSVVRIASEARGDSAREADAAPGGTARWEFVSAGHSVARNCSGVIVARYFDSATAAALRARDLVITL